MGAKDYDFADDMPEYREKNRLNYRSKSSQRYRKRGTPKSKSTPGGIRQRRNKHVNW